MLTIENLKVAYGEKVILEDLSISFEHGQISGVLGMNGAGKTTFFNTLYGFLRQLQGRCLFEGEHVSAQHIGYLETHNSFFSYMRGSEYLELCALSNPQFDIKKWNAIFNLPLDQLVDTYSTGMKKKLAFLGVLALDRPILVLDEPFSGVDLESNEKLFEVLRRLAKQGKTILLSSHIISSLTGVCDRICYLNEGKFDRIFDQKDFGKLETELRAFVQQKIKTALDDLF